jgi:D-beta-D-heptose 7-phosphate kinase/D-beta-D-heptose 1-phosphate adenosyltransferase
MNVWVNGSFDILHIGHIKLLEFASKYGKVKVGLDSDWRIKEFKGKSRPFNSLQDRMDFISSIKYVYDVVSFNSDEELENHIKNWDTDIIVIGDDYKNKKIVGGHLAQNIIFFERIPNKSTTNILSYENPSNW